MATLFQGEGPVNQAALFDCPFTRSVDSLYGFKRNAGGQALALIVSGCTRVNVR